MITAKSTIVAEMVLNEEKTERYLYKRIWSRAKSPKLACVLTINPGGFEPNIMDLTTMLVSNEIYEMKFDGFLLVNLTGEITRQRKNISQNFSDDNDKIILEAFNDEQVEKIIFAVGSMVQTNKDVNAKLSELVKQLPQERQSIIEVLVGKKGPVHPLSPEARSMGGWRLATLSMAT